MDRDVQASVDRLLLDFGEYLPLEYLLQEARLDYADFEAWRGGEPQYLEDALFGDPERIREELAEAGRYLARLGWQAEAVDYTARPSGDAANPRVLRFSRDPAFDASFRRRFRKRADLPQLDLFTDNPGTSLANGVIAALGDADAIEARRLLGRLFESAPDHARLGDLECLVDALETLPTPVDHLDAELAHVQNVLEPLAADNLGASARHLMTPVWRRLAAALDHVPFDPGAPERHASHAAARAMDWPAVRACIERETRWTREPVLLQRHAQACERLRDHAAGTASWFRLCWHFPEQASWLDRSSDRELREDWETFQDLDDALPADAFPAWRLLRRPGLVNRLAHVYDDASPASFRLVQQLCRHHVGQAQPRDRDVMKLRSELKACDPALFAHCLALLSRH